MTEPTREGLCQPSSDLPETLHSTQIYAGKVVDLRLETARLPGGGETQLEVVRHQGAAAALPMFDNGEVMLVRQFRHAGGGWLLELPAGKLDPGEQPETCARRELAEETGLRAATLSPLGTIFTTPGFTDETIALFLATDLTEGEQNLDTDELIELVRMPLASAVELAENGDMTDGKTICAVLRAAARQR